MTTTQAPLRALLPNRPSPASPAPPKKRREWPISVTLYLLGALAVLNAAATAVDILWGENAYAGTWKGFVDAALHLVPATAFTLLGPPQFSTTVRTRWPRFHRVSGRIFVFSGLLAGISALALNDGTWAYGGAVLYSANFVFGLGLIVCLIAGLRAVLQKDLTSHRAWMVRAFAIGLAAGTSRLYILPQFLLFGEPSGLTIGLSMWAIWLTNLTVAEVFVLKRFRR